MDYETRRNGPPQQGKVDPVVNGEPTLQEIVNRERDTANRLRELSEVMAVALGHLRGEDPSAPISDADVDPRPIMAELVYEQNRVMGSTDVLSVQIAELRERIGR